MIRTQSSFRSFVLFWSVDAWQRLWMVTWNPWNRGLPILAKVWTLNSLGLALLMRMTNPGLSRLGYQGDLFYAERASRTMEMVTVRQLISNCAMKRAPFFGPKLNSGFFPTRPCAIVCVISLGSGRLSIPMSMATHVVKFTETMQTLACYWWDHCSVIHSLLFDVFLLYICHFIL